MIRTNTMESGFKEEQAYLKAKKRVKEIKGFYVHLTVTILSIIVIVVVNLQFVPSFHFFWFAVLGMSIGLFFHWLGVFGFKNFGLSKDWEERKIKEFMNNEKNNL